MRVALRFTSSVEIMILSRSENSNRIKRYSMVVYDEIIALVLAARVWHSFDFMSV